MPASRVAFSRIVDTVSSQLRKAGYRVTPQRLAVYRVIHESYSHPNVEEIHGALTGEFPAISMTTVYKAVHALVEVGLVRRLHRGSAAASYDAATSAHAHFLCIVCKRIVDVPLGQEPVSMEGLERLEVIGLNVEVFGFCAECRRGKLGLAPGHAP